MTHKILHHTLAGPDCHFVVSWDHAISVGDTLDMMNGGKPEYSGKVKEIVERRPARGDYEHPHDFVHAKTIKA